MSAVSIRPAYEFPISTQAAAFTLAFSDYVAGPAKLDTEGMVRYFFVQSVDLWLSRLAVIEDRIVGFAYINRTTEISRLAGMGIVPEARKQGIGRQLLAAILNEARARADRVVTLEVFEQNPPAIALYRSFGFTSVARLFGWKRGPGAQSGGPEVLETNLTQLSRRSTVFDYPAVPWAISRHALIKLPPRSRAFFSGTSTAVVMNMEPGLMMIRMLHQEPVDSAPNWPALRTLFQSLLSHFPDCRWTISPIFPEQFGQEIFSPAGFSRDELNQIQMELVLNQ
jgi:GNAT superfamily N-acetyltransferase